MKFSTHFAATPKDPVSAQTHTKHTCNSCAVPCRVVLLVGFFGDTSNVTIPISRDSSSLFLVPTSTQDSSTGSMSSSMGTASRFRVVVGLASSPLSHSHFPTVDSPFQDTARRRSSCGFLQTSLLGSSSN